MLLKIAPDKNRIIRQTNEMIKNKDVAMTIGAKCLGWWTICRTDTCS
jgi:hypothetical protein